MSILGKLYLDKRVHELETKYNEAIAQRDEAKSKGEELCSVLGNLLIHVHELGLRYADRDKFLYRNERAEAAEAKLAILNKDKS